MSGIDEVKRLWILEFRAWFLEDYLHCYRGIYARNKEEAEALGEMVIAYYNRTYNESDDEENPDYVFEGIHSVDSSGFFMISEDLLQHMSKTMLGRLEKEQEES